MIILKLFSRLSRFEFMFVNFLPFQEHVWTSCRALLDLSSFASNLPQIWYGNIFLCIKQVYRKDWSWIFHFCQISCLFNFLLTFLLGDCTFSFLLRTTLSPANAHYFRYHTRLQCWLASCFDCWARTMRLDLRYKHTLFACCWILLFFRLWSLRHICMTTAIL